MVRKVNQTLKYFPKKQKHGEKMAKLGRTPGHVEQTAFANRVYYKPSLRKPVIRYPGVFRRSEKVLEINEKLEALRGSDRHPARQCKGLPWDEFVACMSEKMKAIM